MSLGKLIFLFILICPSFLVANSISINGTLVNGSIDRYCVKPSVNTSFEARVTSVNPNCLAFLDSSGKLGESCSTSSYLYASNLKAGVVYYIVQVRSQTGTTNINYTLWMNAANEVQMGRCPSQALANASGMKSDQMAFALTLSGLAVAILFFGSITHIILNIKEW